MPQPTLSTSTTNPPPSSPPKRLAALRNPFRNLPSSTTWGYINSNSDPSQKNLRPNSQTLPALPRPRQRSIIRSETAVTSDSWTTAGATDPNLSRHLGMVGGYVGGAAGETEEVNPFDDGNLEVASSSSSARQIGFGGLPFSPASQFSPVGQNGLFANATNGLSIIETMEIEESQARLTKSTTFAMKLNHSFTGSTFGFSPSPSSYSSESSTGSSSYDDKAFMLPSSGPHSSFANTKLRREDQLYPDGGLRAWLTILGCSFLLAATFGFQTVLGLLLLHLQQNQLAESSLAEIAWIPATLLFLSLVLMGPMSQLFDRFGCWILLPVSSVGYVGMFFALARCNAFYQFFLTLGVLGGVSSAGIIAVAQGVIGHWFKERHGLASGIAMLGAAAGGIFFPLVLKVLLEKTDWVWAIQGLGFVVLGLLVVGNALVKGRVRSSCATSKIEWAAFGDGRFAWLVAGVFGLELLLITSTGLLPAYAQAADYGAATGFYLVLTLNIGSTLGRTLPSLLTLTLGRYNSLLALCLLTLLTLLALLLPFTHLPVLLYISTLLLGLGTGSFVSLSMACVGTICRLNNKSADLGRWIAALDVGVCLATLVGLPILAIVLKAYGGKAVVGVWSAVLVGSVVAVGISRRKCGAGWRWKVVI